MDRNETIRRICIALKQRSGKVWSVTGGHGTACHDYWQEYIDRAEGKTPSVIGKQYWD